MEIYVQNENFVEIGIIENFESLIWTERDAAFGDFELVMPISDDHRALLKDAIFFKIAASKDTMILDSITETHQYKIKGRTLVSVLEQRVVETSGPITSVSLTNFVVHLVLHNIGELCWVQERRIPNLIVNYNIPTNDGFVDPSEYNPLKYGENLYSAVKSNCNLQNLGFRIINPPGTDYMEFGFYYGRDLTATISRVVFSESIGNIMNVTRFKSNLPFKNVAVVNLPSETDEFSGGQHWRIYNGPAPTGLKRREVWSDASDLRKAEDFSWANVDSRTKAWGLLELTWYPPANDIDFEVTKNSQYVYDVDYTIGDTVMVLDNAGATIKHRVTEYIRSFGPEGYAEYPTLTALS
jgi:hypothetical protein